MVSSRALHFEKLFLTLDDDGGREKKEKEKTVGRKRERERERKKRIINVLTIYRKRISQALLFLREKVNKIPVKSIYVNSFSYFFFKNKGTLIRPAGDENVLEGRKIARISDQNNQKI